MVNITVWISLQPHWLMTSSLYTKTTFFSLRVVWFVASEAREQKRGKVSFRRVSMRLTDRRTGFPWTLLSSSDSQLNRLTHNAFKPLCLSLRPSLSITRPCLYHFPHTAVVLATFPCAFFLCHTFSLCHKLSVHSLQRRSSLAPWRGHEVAVPPGGTLPSQPSQSCSNIQYVPNFLSPFFLIGGW